MHRVVTPRLNFACTPWPMHATIANEVDSVQFKMLASFFMVARLHADEPRDYFRRRNRHASELHRRNERWSLICAKLLNEL